VVGQIHSTRRILIGVFCNDKSSKISVLDEIPSHWRRSCPPSPNGLDPSRELQMASPARRCSSAAFVSTHPLPASRLSMSTIVCTSSKFPSRSQLEVLLHHHSCFLKFIDFLVSRTYHRSSTNESFSCECGFLSKSPKSFSNHVKQCATVLTVTHRNAMHHSSRFTQLDPVTDMAPCIGILDPPRCG